MAISLQVKQSGLKWFRGNREIDTCHYVDLFLAFNDIKFKFLEFQ